jgi:hypothetical protein
MERIIVFALAVFDLLANVFTFGWWGRSQGDKSSGAHVQAQPRDFHARYDDIPAEQRSKHRKDGKLYK